MIKVGEANSKARGSHYKQRCSLDDDITDDLYQVMEEEEEKAMDGVELGSFRQLFWSQQKEAAGKQDKRGMRWHPAMIKWCLFLRHQS